MHILYFIWSAFKNIHGRIVSLNLCFVFLTTSLLIVLFNVEPDTIRRSINPGEFFLRLSSTACGIVGYSLYFSGLSMFVWMALLCFDLFHTLNELKLPKDSSLEFWNRRLICYSCVGFGVPLVLTLTTLIVDHLKPFSQMPDVGAESCFLTIKGTSQRNQCCIF